MELSNVFRSTDCFTCCHVLHPTGDVTHLPRLFEPIILLFVGRVVTGNQVGDSSRRSHSNFFQHGDVYRQSSGSFVLRRWLIVDFLENQCPLLSEANEMHRRAGRDPFLGRVLSLSFGQRIRPFRTVRGGEQIILTFHLQSPTGKIPSHFVTHLNITQSEECQVIDQHFPPTDENSPMAVKWSMSCFSAETIGKTYTNTLYMKSCQNNSVKSFSPRKSFSVFQGFAK